MTKNKTLVALYPEGFLESGFSLFIKKGTVNPVFNLMLLRISYKLPTTIFKLLSKLLSTPL